MNKYLSNTFLAILLFASMAAGAVAPPYAYITNAGNNSVSVIDTATDTVTATIPVGNFPYGVAVNPTGTKVYVTNRDNPGSISVIDTATNNVTASIPVEEYPGGLAVNPAGTKLYVANGMHNVSVIDTATNAVTAEIPLEEYGRSQHPDGVAVNPAGTKVYVTTHEGCWGGFCFADVYTIDTATNTVNLIKSISGEGFPVGVAVNPAGTNAYVANERRINKSTWAHLVSVIDTVTNDVATSIPVEGQPIGVAVNPAGTRLYVTNNNNVSVIDTSTNSIITAIPVEDYPYGVAVNPTGTKVYVANFGSGNVSVIDTATNTVTSRIPVGTGPIAFGQFIGPETSISGIKFEDLNANGIKDANETGLAGWNITIKGTDAITGILVKLTTTTDSNGNYNFTGLTAGTYVISETLKSGWIQTAPPTGNYTVTLTSGANITGQDFSNFHKGNITGGGWITIMGDPKATFSITGNYSAGSNTAQGSVIYQDHYSNLKIQSIKISTVATTLDKKKGVITGFAKVNGKGSYPFVVYIEDNSESGVGANVFRISLPTYPYSNGAVLSGGNIKIYS